MQWALGQVATAKGDPPAGAALVLAAGASLYGRPQLLDLQHCLPALPLPALAGTIERFLETVRPLLSPLDMWRTEQAARAFLAEGRELQERLAAMHAASLTPAAAAESWRGIGDRNWLAPLWLRVAYLRGRAPLPVNVSFYSTDQLRLPPKTGCQAARAAGMVLGALEFWDRVTTGSLPPFLAGKGAVRAPVDMSGYPWLVGGVRVPGTEEDAMEVHDPGRHEAQAASDRRRMGDAHIVVARGTALFRVPVQRGGRRITFSELRAAMQSCLEAVPEPKGPSPRVAGRAAVSPECWSFPDAAPLGLLTTAPRSDWAEAREALLAGEGAAAVRACEEALLGVSLFFERHDEAGAEPCGTEGGRPDGSSAAEVCTDRVWSGGNRIARTAFTGSGFSWWCDKTVSIGVFADGRSCWHVEHTPADAPVPSHLVEHAVVREADIVHAHAGPGEAAVEGPGHLARHAYPELAPATAADASSPFSPSRLAVPATPRLSAALADAADGFRELCGGTGLFLGLWDGWGSDAIKRRFGCPPDAFVQAVLQVAGARFFGRAVLTYESASTRAFAHGRTETIRSATFEAQALAELAQSAGEGAEDDEALLAALKASCAAHRRRTKEAMAGRGVDRHLLALRVLDQARADASGSALSRLWASPGWALEYELSTSQTPLVQEHHKAMPGSEACALGGGFGPSCAGGVGVSYFVLDKFLAFHVSSNRTADDEAACGAPAATVAGLRADAGSPLAHAVAFWRCIRDCLAQLEAASRRRRPEAWTERAAHL